MATLTTFTAGTAIRSADVNANFAALNTDVAGANRTGYASGTRIINVGTGVDDLHSWTMPAGTLSAVGDGLLIRSHFTFSGTANAKAVNLVIGTATPKLLHSTLAPSSKDLHVDLTVLVVATTANDNMIVTGTPILCGTSFGTAPAFEDAISNVATKLDTGDLASSMVIKFTGQGTVDADIAQNYALISIFKAAA